MFVYSVSRAARYPSSGASPKGTNCAPARYSPTASSQSRSKSVRAPPFRASAPASAACRGETGTGALLKLVLQQCQTGGNLSIDPGLLGSTLSDLLQSNFAGLFQPGNPGNPGNPGTGAPGQTPDAPQEPSGDQTFESEVVRLINEQRAQYGLSALAASQELSQVAPS